MRRIKFPNINNLDIELDLLSKFVSDIGGKVVTELPSPNQTPEYSRFFKKISETKYEEYIKIGNKFILLNAIEDTGSGGGGNSGGGGGGGNNPIITYGYNPLLPYRISGFRFWVHPETIYGLGIGVSYWNDKSAGNSHLLVLNNVHSVEILPHYKAVKPDFTYSYLMTEAPTHQSRVLWGQGATGSFTIFAVMKYISGDNKGLFCQYSDSNGNGVIAAYSSSPNMIFVVRDDGGTQEVSVSVPLTQFSNAPVLVVERYDDVSKRLDVWVNGANYNATNSSLNLATAGQGITDETSMSRFGLGCLINPATNNFDLDTGMVCHIAEFMVFVRALTSSEINQLASNIISYYNNQLGWSSIT